MIPKFSSLTGAQKAVYISAAVVFFAVAGPILGMAAFAAYSMVMFMVWAIIIAGGIIFWPAINRVMKTMALRLAKANARMSPIETLELDFQNKRTALDRFADFVKQMIAAHRVSQEELTQLKKDFPGRDLSDRQKMMDRMKEAVQVLRDKAGEAEQQLTTYGEEIRFIKADNNWAKRATSALTQMKAVSGVDALDELLKGEAIGQVRQNVAEAFAELDMLLEQEGTREVLKIAHDRNPETTDGTSFEVPHFFDNKVKVSA